MLNILQNGPEWDIISFKVLFQLVMCSQAWKEEQDPLAEEERLKEDKKAEK